MLKKIKLFNIYKFIIVNNFINVKMLNIIYIYIIISSIYIVMLKTLCYNYIVSNSIGPYAQGADKLCAGQRLGLIINYRETIDEFIRGSFSGR